jgi:hypothetical protein
VDVQDRDCRDRWPVIADEIREGEVFSRMQGLRDREIMYPLSEGTEGGYNLSMEGKDRPGLRRGA